MRITDWIIPKSIWIFRRCMFWSHVPSETREAKETISSFIFLLRIRAKSETWKGQNAHRPSNLPFSWGSPGVRNCRSGHITVFLSEDISSVDLFSNILFLQMLMFAVRIWCVTLFRQTINHSSVAFDNVVSIRFDCSQHHHHHHFHSESKRMKNERTNERTERREKRRGEKTKNELHFNVISSVYLYVRQE